jgi:hypothetical protein
MRGRGFKTVNAGGAAAVAAADWWATTAAQAIQRRCGRPPDALPLLQLVPHDVHYFTLQLPLREGDGGRWWRSVPLGSEELHSGGRGSEQTRQCRDAHVCSLGVFLAHATDAEDDGTSELLRESLPLFHVDYPVSVLCAVVLPIKTVESGDSCSRTHKRTTSNLLRKEFSVWKVAAVGVETFKLTEDAVCVTAFIEESPSSSSFSSFSVPAGELHFSE